MTRHAAVDLGATSGRVVVADIAADRLDLREVRRFANGPVREADGLHWDLTALYQQALEGLAAAGPVDTVGVDSWAVDYGLLGPDGALLNQPWSYRDSRTDGVQLGLSPEEQFAINGLQRLPFTTANQLAVDKAVSGASTVLLLPDLITYWLCGVRACEITNTSTTGLLDVRSRDWSPEMLAAAGVLPAQLPELVQPGQRLGRADGLAAEVIAVGSHDTASAVVAVPMDPSAAAYVSLGTWGLVGVELEQPVLTDVAFQANFTNELGVDGRVRFLRNVAGLFLLTECLRDWQCSAQDRDRLLRAAADASPGPVFDVDDPRLSAPGDMPARITALLLDSGSSAPQGKAQLVRSVLDSLAAKLARTVEEAARLSGCDVTIVHVVGGGAQNTLLCQLLADAVAMPVVAGPVEATAIGNALVQARAVGALQGPLEALRSLVRRTQRVRTYEPRR